MKTRVQMGMPAKRLPVILMLFLILFTTAYLISSTTAENNQSTKEIERIEETEYGRIIYYKDGTKDVEIIIRENVEAKTWHTVDTWTVTVYTTNPLWDFINNLIRFIMGILPGLITALFAEAIKKLGKLLRNIYWRLKRRKRPSFYGFLQLIKHEAISALR